jgi:hypothetical protein
MTATPLGTIVALLLLAACGSSSDGALFGGATAGAGVAGAGGAGAGGAGVGGTVSTGGQIVVGGGGVAAGGGAPGGGGAGLLSGSGGILPGNGGGGGTGGVRNGSGGAGGSGGVGTSTGGLRTLDAGPLPVGDAGHGGPSAGVIVCAGTQCAIAGTPTNTCCVGAGLFPTQCLPSFPGCGVTAGFAISCDDTADCASGQICCGALSGASAGSRCAATCDSSSFQLCRADAQCPGKACRPIAAAPAYSACN